MVPYIFDLLFTIRLFRTTTPPHLVQKGTTWEAVVLFDEMVQTSAPVQSSWHTDVLFRRRCLNPKTRHSMTSTWHLLLLTYRAPQVYLCVVGYLRCPNATSKELIIAGLCFRKWFEFFCLSVIWLSVYSYYLSTVENNINIHQYFSK